MARRSEVGLARVYDAVERGEGARVLVDRLWPRGIKRTDPRVGRWLPAVAPSNELRRWYDHRAALCHEFGERYIDQLGEPAAAEAFAERASLAQDEHLLLVTATKELDLSHAAVLQRLLSRG